MENYQIVQREVQEVEDPSGNYKVIYIDVMRLKERVRRFVKPLSNKNITIDSVLSRANSFAKAYQYESNCKQYIG